jgi:hypothetical protein
MTTNPTPAINPDLAAVRSGQTIDFVATGVVKVEKGRVTGNRHLADKLTLYRLFGVTEILS